ncbi:MAG: ATP-grasp domain-containing protein [Alphaproteobacteria bacterium]
MNFVNNSKNIIIVHGADEERLTKDEEDTINQALEIKETVNKIGLNADIYNLKIPFKKNMNHLKNGSHHLIFNLVEAIKGKGKYSHLAPALFDKMQIPYTGNNSNAIRITSNKILTKEILNQNNIPTPHWLYGDDVEEFDSPYIVKSVTEDASIGIDMNSVVYSKSEMQNLIIDKTNTFGGRWFAEQYIDGREFNISILEQDGNPFVMPCAEIVFDSVYNNHHKIVDYASKWEENSVFYKASRRVFPEEERVLFDKLREICIKCWKIFGLSGYARIDFRVDKNENPLVLEINTNPCLAQDAGFAQACLQKGIEYHNLIRYILKSATFSKEKTNE